MTQFGIKQGNRSAHWVGYAQSYKAKLSLSDEECMAHDKDVIGAAGIFWSAKQPKKWSGTMQHPGHNSKVGIH